MELIRSFCKNYIQPTGSVYILVSLLSFSSGLCTAANIVRSPANFVPDEDVIIVPIVLQKSFVDDFHEKHEKDFKSAKKKLAHWISQEEYAKNYGLEYTGIVKLPTAAEKSQFFHRHYLRFFSRDIEKKANTGINDTISEWTTDDEIDAITYVELHERVLVRAKGNSGKSGIGAAKTVKVGEKSFKFVFQPRIEIGMANFTVESKYFNARAWVGINGSQELKVERYFSSTATRAFVNFYLDQTKILAFVDQRISPRWALRLTHNKDFNSYTAINESINSENNTLQARFNMVF